MNTEDKKKIIEKYELKSGQHKNIDDGACIMEMVSYLADEPWSDHPKCACPVLTKYAMRYNDRVDSVQRQKLKALIPKLINSRDHLKVKARANFLVLQSITVFLPTLTEALDLKEITEKVRSFKDGEWLAARDYINSVRPEIRSMMKKKTAAAADAAYAAYAAAADAADAAYAAYAAAADAAYAAYAADAAYAAAADAAAAAAADAAYAAYADAAYAAAADAAYAAPSSPNRQKWIDLKQKIYDQGYEALEKACDI